jgi:hypothetical protein
MKARSILLAALGAAVTLTSVAAAGPDAAKQRVAIDTKILPQGKFVLTPLQSGALKRDLGRISGNWQSIQGRHVMRDGQEITIYAGRWTLTGKRGTLTIRERTEWVDVGGDANDDAAPDSVAVGTWKVVRGTGQYVKLAGAGRSGHEGLGHTWYARYEGFLTSS